MPEDDAELLRALQEEHGGALYSHALRLSNGDRQRAEDLVQETLLRAWRHPESLDPDRGSVRAWLFTTARHLAIEPECECGHVGGDDDRRIEQENRCESERFSEALGESPVHVLPVARRMSGQLVLRRFVRAHASLPGSRAPRWRRYRAPLRVITAGTVFAIIARSRASEWSSTYLRS